MVMTTVRVLFNDKWHVVVCASGGFDSVVEAMRSLTENVEFVKVFPERVCGSVDGVNGVDKIQVSERSRLIACFGRKMGVSSDAISQAWQEVHDATARALEKP